MYTVLLCVKEDKESSQDDLLTIKAEAEQLLKDVEGMGKKAYLFIKKGLEKHANDSAFEGNGWVRVWVQDDEIESSSKYPEILKMPDEAARIEALKELARELAHEALRLADSSAAKVGVQNYTGSLSPSDHDRIDWVALATPQVEAESSLKQAEKVCPKCREKLSLVSRTDKEGHTYSNWECIECNNKQAGSKAEGTCYEENCNEPIFGSAPFGGRWCKKHYEQKNKEQVEASDFEKGISQNKIADEPAVEPKVFYKELKKAPSGVDRERATPASPDLDVVLAKMDALEQNLATLDNAKKQIQAKMKEEIAKLEQSAERVQMEKELQESINKAGVLIDALESKVVSWRDKIYTLQTQEVSYVPNITPKEMLEKVYAKFEGAQKFVEAVLSGMKSQAVNVLEKTLVKFPGKKSSLNKEASVIDQWNDELLAALKELSSPL